MSDNTLNPMESKSIKDYLHLYLGCEAKGWRSEDAVDTVKIDANFLEQSKAFYLKVMPILRPLWDMTDEEVKEFIDYERAVKMYQSVKYVKLHSGIDISYEVDADGWLMPMSAFVSFSQFTPAQFSWLLTRGFDLFGLIDAGLAIKKSQ